VTPDELLATTWAVRKRLDLDRPVPAELVEECPRIALPAPDGSNAQRWHRVRTSLHLRPAGDFAPR
jgi:nitroreductase